MNATILAFALLAVGMSAAAEENPSKSCASYRNGAFSSEREAELAMREAADRIALLYPVGEKTVSPMTEIQMPNLFQFVIEILPADSRCPATITGASGDVFDSAKAAYAAAKPQEPLVQLRENEEPDFFFKHLYLSYLEMDGTTPIPPEKMVAVKVETPIRCKPQERQNLLDSGVVCGFNFTLLR